MSTRSNIIVQLKTGKWAEIYCHYDGYPSNNGRILIDHYNDQKRAESLVKLGDLSVLAPKTDKPIGHSFATPIDGHCIAYGRDRGEKGTKARRGDTLESVWPDSDAWTEYAYVWSNGHWHVAAVPGPIAGLQLVAKVLADESVSS